MLKTALILGVVLCTLVVGPAQAEGVNQRERHQGSRIYGGIQNGELSRGEARRVSRDLAHVQRVEDRFRQSGSGYSARERCATQAMLNRSSNRIYRLKHN